MNREPQLHPLKLKPLMKPVIWGGSAIGRFKGGEVSTVGIGESWEVSAIPGFETAVDDLNSPFNGQSLSEITRRHPLEMLGKRLGSRSSLFPLMVKIIDAAKDLSVQVHPRPLDDPDSIAGKDEMWHIIEASPQAKIHLGLKNNVDAEDFVRRVHDGSVMDVVNTYDSRPGDTYYIPGGCIHAIGAGNMLIEVQQTCDTTYRVHDYNRLDANGQPRQLHTTEALAHIDFKIPGASHLPTSLPDEDPAETLLTDGEYFRVVRMRLSDNGGSSSPGAGQDSFTIVTTLDGEARIAWGDNDDNYVTIPRGHTILFPASTLPLRAVGNATIISVTPK